MKFKAFARKQGYSFVNESSQGYMLVKFDTKTLKLPALKKVSAIMQDYTNSVSFDIDGNFLIAAVDDPDVEIVVSRISKLSPAYAKRITVEEDKPVEIPDDMDESFRNVFLDGLYKLYVKRVMAKLQKLVGAPVELNARIESWIKDFYEDKFSPEDCAHSIHETGLSEGFINTTQTLKEEVNMNSEEELMIAKRTAERAGYKVEMPKASTRGAIADNAARIAAAKARLGYGTAPQAAPARSVADDLDRLALAARTAEKAGYTVRKIDAAPAPAPAPEPAPAPQNEPTKKEYSPWLAGAAKFMSREQ